MGTMISSANDVITFLKEQHRQIEAGFDQVQTATGEERQAAFLALRRLLAVHETAEEEIVHPAARRALPDGDLIVDARLQEENEAKRLLSGLEDRNVDSAEFEREFAQLKSAVLLHARAEEEDEFERLALSLDQKELERMRSAVNLAERVAPTRPHPGVESPLSNMLAGPFVSMIDRARDALSGKS